METINIVSGTTAPRADDDFPDVARVVQRSVAGVEPPYFRTAVEGLRGDDPRQALWLIYLAGFSGEERQVHNCHACRRFVETYGDLVTIDETGRTRSVFWRADLVDVPSVYRKSIEMMCREIERSPVSGLHLSELEVWGVGRNHDKKRDVDWSHFEYRPARPYSNKLKTAHQRAAEVAEELGMLERGLAEFSADVVAKAAAIVGTEQLYRGEKVLGVVTWLTGLHTRLAGEKNERLRKNILWRAAALAPPGFCHVRSTMVGTLLEDLAAAGVDFADVKRRFADKMHPLQYQRPTAAPSEMGIEEAEKVIEKLGVAASLKRRFAKLEDVAALWRPAPVEAPSPPVDGVFAHLKESVREKLVEDVGEPVVVTWEKFARTALPSAIAIDFLVPSHGNFAALITAEDPTALPIIQWDREERRNPVTQYLYMGGSSAGKWNLESGWRRVAALTLLPNMWDPEYKGEHQGKGAIFILEGARDLKHEKGGGLFPEVLRSEFHAIRRVIEAHVKASPIAGRDEATACGYMFQKNEAQHVEVRVTSIAGLRQRYRIDRWD